MTREGDDNDGTVQDLGQLSCFLTLVEGLRKSQKLYCNAINQGDAAEGAGLNREIICRK